jgi:chromosome segregation ATPase
VTVTGALVQAANMFVGVYQAKGNRKAGYEQRLIEERDILVKELHQRAQEVESLSVRFTQIEKDNHELRMGQVTLQQQLATLEIERLQDKDEISRLKAALQKHENSTL